MNKTDLIEAIAERAELSKVASGRLLEIMLEIIGETLEREEDINLVGFGSFSVIKRQQRQGRNPSTGELITIPAAKVPRFRPGKLLKNKVNNE